VLLQEDNYGFSASVMFRSKAQCAGNGSSLIKRRNAAAGHHRDARRVSLSAPMNYVVPLAKETTLTCETRLAMKADKLTELAIITLEKH
jgi:hypothetical protein